jgi:Xaa-Pro aminopeptidase
MNLEEIQEQLKAEQVDGWLFFDHHHRDPIAYRVLGLPLGGHVSRRWYYWIPAVGLPVKLVHRIESGKLDAVPGERLLYSSWKEQHERLGEMLGGASRIAMQYSPDCMIPYVSLVDGGTIDLVRGLGKEVVSSAALVQYFEARWSAGQLEAHLEAGKLIDGIRRAAFEETGRRIRSDGSVQEAAIAEFIRKRFDENGLYAEDGPIVAVNANSGNPHYAPTEELTSPIRAEDFLLIDLWARFDRPGAVYYDITWTGYAGISPPPEIENVFRIVRDARDKAVDFVRAAVAAGREIRGCDIDDVTRGFIRGHGFGEHFTHRTGHSIGEEVHGNGANIDNLETKDERRIIPRTCFSIEPGIYLPNFGVRCEIDCYVGESSAGPTGEVQTELVRIDCMGCMG